MSERLLAPSPWIVRCTPLVRAGGRVLDLACGHGRHARWFAARGHPVLGIDRDAEAIAALDGIPRVEAVVADLEGPAWPLDGQRFDAVVVTNYLFRRRLPELVDAVAPGGVLVYETFARGNEVFGRPANPDFLLRPGELLGVVLGELEVVGYEHGMVDLPRAGVVQRIAAVRGAASGVAIP